MSHLESLGFIPKIPAHPYLDSCICLKFSMKSVKPPVFPPKPPVFPLCLFLFSAIISYTNSLLLLFTTSPKPSVVPVSLLYLLALLSSLLLLSVQWSFLIFQESFQSLLSSAIKCIRVDEDQGESEQLEKAQGGNLG